MSLEVVILAAGQGTRMRSSLPKVLHTIGHQSMLAHVVSTAKQLNPDAIHIVYGHDGDKVRSQLGQDGLNWVEQANQEGTGHAVKLAMGVVQNQSTVLVMYGDVPLIREATLHKLVAAANDDCLALLTAVPLDPNGLGRIVRNEARDVIRIVEQKEANESELAIGEINTGFIAVKASPLNAWLAKLSKDNSQGEYYLTDCVEHAAQDGVNIASICVNDEIEILGVNSKLELARAERAFQQRQADELMRLGVSLKDPARFDLRGQCEVGDDCEIDVDVTLAGKVVLGDRVRIGRSVIIRNSMLGNDVDVGEFCLIENVDLASNRIISAYSHINAESQVTMLRQVRLGDRR